MECGAVTVHLSAFRCIFGGCSGFFRLFVRDSDTEFSPIKGDNEVLFITKSKYL